MREQFYVCNLSLSHNYRLLLTLIQEIAKTGFRLIFLALSFVFQSFLQVQVRTSGCQCLLSQLFSAANWDRIRSTDLKLSNTDFPRVPYAPVWLYAAGMQQQHSCSYKPGYFGTGLNSCCLTDLLLNSSEDVIGLCCKYLNQIVVTKAFLSTVKPVTLPRRMVA